MDADLATKFVYYHLAVPDGADSSLLQIVAALTERHVIVRAWTRCQDRDVKGRRRRGGEGSAEDHSVGDLIGSFRRKLRDAPGGWENGEPRLQVIRVGHLGYMDELDVVAQRLGCVGAGAVDAGAAGSPAVDQRDQPELPFALLGDAIGAPGAGAGDVSGCVLGEQRALPGQVGVEGAVEALGAAVGLGAGGHPVADERVRRGRLLA